MESKISLTIVAGTILVFWLVVAVRGPRVIKLDHQLAVLRYGSTLRILALVLALLPLAVLIAGIWLQRWRSDWAAAGILLGASMVCGLLLLEVERVQMVLTADGIVRHSPWRRVATLAWSDIQMVRYSALNQWFVVVGAGHTIRVSRHLRNVGIFAAEMQTRVAPERWASAAISLQALKASS